jgi:hypothetical protein
MVSDPFWEISRNFDFTHNILLIGVFVIERFNATYSPSSEVRIILVSVAGDSARNGRTIASSKCSSTAVGFLQHPVCTGEV